MDEIDRKILKIIQEGFPVCDDPYDEIGKKIGMKGDEVFKRIENLYSDGYIIKISPKFIRKKDGFNALIGIRVKSENVENVANFLNNFNEISHNDLREHEYNIWFTLSAKSEEEFNEILNTIRKNDKIEDMVVLPTKRVFKVNLEFDIDDK